MIGSTAFVCFALVRSKQFLASKPQQTGIRLLPGHGEVATTSGSTNSNAELETRNTEIELGGRLGSISGRLLRRFIGTEHCLEFPAGQELNGVGLDENLGVLIGLASTDDDGDVNAEFHPGFLGGFCVWQVDDGFLPSSGFKNHGATGVDGAQSDAHFGFDRVRQFNPEILGLHDLHDRLVDLFRGDVAGPLERIRWDLTALFEAAGFDAREGHGGGEESALRVADDGAAGTPGNESHAVKGDPTADAKTDELPGFNFTEEGGGIGCSHKDQNESNP